MIFRPSLNSPRLSNWISFHSLKHTSQAVFSLSLWLPFKTSMALGKILSSLNLTSSSHGDHSPNVKRFKESTCIKCLPWDLVHSWCSVNSPLFTLRPAFAGASYSAPAVPHELCSFILHFSGFLLSSEVEGVYPPWNCPQILNRCHHLPSLESFCTQSQ